MNHENLRLSAPSVQKIYREVNDSIETGLSGESEIAWIVGIAKSPELPELLISPGHLSYFSYYSYFSYFSYFLIIPISPISPI